MAKPIIDLELTAKADGQNRYAEISLPATDYELLDALEILRVQDDKDIAIYGKEYHGFPWLATYYRECGGLFGLNALTRELAKLDETQSVVFGGLLKMEERKQEPIKLPRLLALAVSAKVNDCHVVNVSNDAGLGRFYAENGFLTELEEIPDSIFDSIFQKLDFAKFGEEAREREHGEFVPATRISRGGYVVNNEDLEPDVEIEDLSPKKPAYAILLEVSKGYFHDAAYDNNITALLPLPASSQEMDAALDRIEAADWGEAVFRCVDCCAPVFIDRIGNEDNIAHVNRLAQRLADMEPDQLSKFKAVLDFKGDYTVLGATDVAYHLDDYNLEAGIQTPEEAALAELRTVLDDQAVAELRPFLNLYGYGEALIQKYGASLNDYGMVEVKHDGQVQAQEQSPVVGGMEMM